MSIKLCKWLASTRAQNILIGGRSYNIKQDFTPLLAHNNFQVMSRCLHRFKARHSVVGKSLSGVIFTCCKSDA